MPKNILIISENFSFGGLETQIYDQQKHLKKKGIKTYLLCKNFYHDQQTLFEEIYDNLDFSSDLNPIRLNNLVNRIVEITKELKIDLIHVHPFWSFLPAVLAANIAKVPIVYTVHGIATINSYDNHLNGNYINKLLYNYGMEKIFTVSESLYLLTKNICDNNKLEILNNSVDMELFRESQFPNNKKWAIISRLDKAKTFPIYDFIKIIKKTEIKELHIYGDGSEINVLNEHIEKHNLGNVIKIKGKSDFIFKDLLNKYDGIIGMGRVILEACAMNIPAVLMSYNGIVDVINEENIGKFGYNNFNGRGFSCLNEEQISTKINLIYKNPQEYFMREHLPGKYDSKYIWGRYENIINKIEYKFKDEINQLHNIINNLEESEPIYNSVDFNNKLMDFKPEFQKQFIYHEQFQNIHEAIEKINNNIDTAKEKEKLLTENQSLKQKIIDISLNLEERDKLITDISLKLDDQDKLITDISLKLDDQDKLIRQLQDSKIYKLVCKFKKTK
ncbi:MAG: glycosyltransferase [Bacilli bacterium]|nr:glycosyltransferase [Bacilli bacterium]